MGGLLGGGDLAPREPAGVLEPEQPGEGQVEDAVDIPGRPEIADRERVQGRQERGVGFVLGRRRAAQAFGAAGSTPIAAE